MNRGTLVVAGAVAALALFAGGYALGAGSFQPKPVAATGTPAGAGTGGPGTGIGGPGAGGPGAGGAGRLAGGGFNAPVNGRVISVNADSITIAVSAPRVAGAAGQPSGSPALTSSIALVGSGTRVVRIAESDSKLADLRPNDQVTIVGTTDASTGTISAQTIVVGGNVLGGLFGGGGLGGPGGPGAPRPSPSPTR